MDVVGLDRSGAADAEGILPAAPASFPDTDAPTMLLSGAGRVYPAGLRDNLYASTENSAYTAAGPIWRVWRATNIGVPATARPTL